jgi:hypothetical protein
MIERTPVSFHKRFDWRVVRKFQFVALIID